MLAIDSRHDTVPGPASSLGGRGDRGAMTTGTTQPMQKSRLPQPTQIARMPPRHGDVPPLASLVPAPVPMQESQGPARAAAGGNRIRVRIKRSELDRIRTTVQHSGQQDSPLRRAFTAWRQLTAQSRALWRLQIKLAARLRYAALTRVLRVMRKRIKEKREERQAIEHYHASRALIVLDHWQTQLDRTRKHRSDHLRATEHHASTLTASSFLHILVTFRRRHHFAVLLSAARLVHQRNLLARSLTHWSDATIEQKRLRAPLAWAQRQVANVQLASRVLSVWAMRMADVRREREFIGIADRVGERLVKERALRVWMGGWDRVRKMQAAANAHFAVVQGKLPSHDQSIARMGAALDRWRSVLAHHQSLESASTLAVQHAQTQLSRRVLVAWKNKLAHIRQLTLNANTHRLHTHLTALRHQFKNSISTSLYTLANAHYARKFLTHWRIATARRIQTHVLADRIARFRTQTLAFRALRAWIHETQLRKARTQLKIISSSIYAANLAARVLRTWAARVDQVRDERVRMCRAGEWAAHKHKERAWTGWVLVCEMRRVKEERKVLAGEYCERKWVAGVWERWVARCARVRWERESYTVADAVASKRVGGDVVRVWRDRLLGRRREQAIVVECERWRAEKAVAACMRVWMVWVRERQVERRQVEVADTWNAVRLIRKVFARAVAEVRLTSVGRAVHEEQMLKQVVATWKRRYHGRADEHQRVDELREALGKRILERHLIAWLLRTKSAILKHLKRDRAIRMHQTNLVGCMLRLWSAKSTLKRRLWVQSQKAVAFHTSSLLRSTFHSWHASRPDWSRVFARNLARPREFHNLGVVRKAFDTWRVEVVKRKAAVWRMGVVERLRRVETDKGAPRLREAGAKEGRDTWPVQARRKQDGAVELEMDVRNASWGAWRQETVTTTFRAMKALELSEPGVDLSLNRRQPRLWPSAELEHLFSSVV